MSDMGLPALRHDAHARRCPSPAPPCRQGRRRRRPSRKRRATAHERVGVPDLRVLRRHRGARRGARPRSRVAVGTGGPGFDRLGQAAPRHQARAVPGRHARGATERFGNAFAHPGDRRRYYGHGARRLGQLSRLARRLGHEFSEHLASAEPVPNHGLSGAFAKAMEVAASEARVLLVGDVGLASSR